MSLRKYSAELMKTVDVIVYHNGISDKNSELLRSLHGNIYFPVIEFPEEWEEILSHPRVLRWGEYVVCKLFGFELVKHYERVLHLDADMHVCSDISELFQIDGELAWRSIIGWDIGGIFADILPEKSNIRCGNGGLFIFTDKLLKYNIDAETVKAAFDEVKNLRDGGIDELVTAWLVHKKGIRLKELDMNIYNTPVACDRGKSKLVHFLDYYSVSGKPWKNPAAFICYGDWAENYRRWVVMGGADIISFAEKDYRSLFGYDRIKEINRLKDELAAIGMQMDEYTKELERQKEEAFHLKEENKRLGDEICQVNRQNLCLEAAVGVLIGSSSWKITKPLRVLADLFRKIGKRLF